MVSQLGLILQQPRKGNMIKNKTVIEMEVKGRNYRLECSPDSPLNEVMEALSAIHECVAQRLKAVQETKQAQEEPQS